MEGATDKRWSAVSFLHGLHEKGFHPLIAQQLACVFIAGDHERSGLGFVQCSARTHEVFEEGRIGRPVGSFPVGPENRVCIELPHGGCAVKTFSAVADEGKTVFRRAERPQLCGGCRRFGREMDAHVAGRKGVGSLEHFFE